MKTYKSTIDRIKLVKESSDFPKAQINSSKDINEYIRQFYFEDIEIYESVFIVLLNTKNTTTGYVKISQGGTAGTVVDIKLIAKYALESLAASLILCHNHPSGNTTPSNEDKNITAKVKTGLNLIDVKLLDHIILTPEKDKYFSFADDGLL